MLAEVVVRGDSYLDPPGLGAVGVGVSRATPVSVALIHHGQDVTILIVEDPGTPRVAADGVGGADVHAEMC